MAIRTASSALAIGPILKSASKPRIAMGGGKSVDAQLAEKVKALRDEGKTQEQIAAELRIVQSTVSVILRRGGLGGRLTSARTPQRS
jgi:Homeodomain-like domain